MRKGTTLGVLCPLCAHYAPFRESKERKSMKNMVGTRRLELLTSTVSNLTPVSYDATPKKRE